MSQTPAFDPSIPVLTEVVADEPAAEPVPAGTALAGTALAGRALAATAPAEPASAVLAPAEPAPAEPALALPSRHDVVSEQLEALAIDSWTEPEWTVLEQRLSERLLLQLQDRVDTALAQQLHEGLAGVLEQAVAQLAVDIRDGLQQSIKQVVAGAVADELAQLQALRR